MAGSLLAWYVPACLEMRDCCMACLVAYGPHASGAHAWCVLPGACRPARQLYPSGRARLLHPAPQPEAVGRGTFSSPHTRCRSPAARKATDA